MEAKYKVGDRVRFYDCPAVVLEVEIRQAGFPDYFIEVHGQGTEHAWAQENELEAAE